MNFTPIQPSLPPPSFIPSMPHPLNTEQIRFENSKYGSLLETILASRKCKIGYAFLVDVNGRIYKGCNYQPEIHPFITVCIVTRHALGSIEPEQHHNIRALIRYMSSHSPTVA